MHALHAALAARRDAASPAVAQLLAALEEAGPEVTTTDVQITSFGGVGSTQLSNHLNAHGITTNLLTDTDNLRHCPRPPRYAGNAPAAVAAVAAVAVAVAVAEGKPSDAVAGAGSSSGSSAAAGPGRADHGATAGTSGSAGGSNGNGSSSGVSGSGSSGVRPRHVVYLYGDPLAAVASHYRRGHACHQAQKTSGHPARLSPATFPPTLEEYVARGEDLFGLEDHFRGWLCTEVDYPVTLLRYEHMFDEDVARPLFHLLCGHKLADEQLAKMTAVFVSSKRPRSSQVPSELCNRMYGSLLAEMDRLPPLYTRPASAPAAATAGTSSVGSLAVDRG